MTRGVAPPTAQRTLLLVGLLLCLPPAFAGSRKAPATVEEIAERAGDWIVALRVERSKDLPAPRLPVRGLPREMRSYYERPEGWVSGILVDSDGHIVTSDYNVGGEVKSIEVKLPTGEDRRARVVARSPADDVALLKIERTESDEPLPFNAPQWADPSRLRAGRIILAVGRSPDPAKVTATRGILSAVNRNGGRAVQTDAELNYGNVGGPILDLDGHIVAMASFVGHTRSQWGVNSGVGFGTTGAAITGMLPELKQGRNHSPFRFPLLGVRSAADAVQERGAPIDSVLENGPADRAGMKAGDVILEIRGDRVKSFQHLRRIVFECGVGEQVKVKVKRGEDTVELEVVLGEIK